MKISKVFQTKGTSRGSLFCIESSTLLNISVGAIVKLNFGNKDYHYYFKVIEVSTTEESSLYFKANEVGYYNKFSKISNFDLRDLIGKTIEIVEDKETLKMIKEESCYC